MSQRRTAKVVETIPAQDNRHAILRTDIRGCGWIRTTEVERQQIYSLPHLATLEHTQCLIVSR